MPKYKKYSEYKDSGTEWLGTLPLHWKALRLGQFFEERREKVSDKDFSALSVTKQGIVPQLDTAAKTDAGDNRKLVRKNDFVINSRSDRKGSAGVSRLDGSVSLISIVLEPREIDPDYVHHLLRCYPFQEEFYRFGKGIVADLWSTNSSEMKNILIPSFPLPEQKLIARFLDHETGKIDRLIQKQQQLIELLKEKRQAVISHAVTKGLNPNTPLKPSNIEWLGDVPEHWDVVKCGHYLNILSGYAFPSSGFIKRNENTTPLLRGINVGVSEIKWDEAVHWQRRSNDGLERFELKQNDIVLGMDRPVISSGVRVAQVSKKDLPCLLLQRVISLRPSEKLDPNFLFSVFTTDMFHAHFLPDSTGVSVPHISPDQVSEFRIALPPKSEQTSITKAIAQSETLYSNLNIKAEAQITLLQERRTALISAAVTGKIDVRDWQQPSAEGESGVEKG